MTSQSKAAAYLNAAERKLSWAKRSAEEMHTHARSARLDDVEPVFAALMVNLASCHDALEVAADESGLGTWRDDFEALRKSDPLLLFVWKARDVDTHTPIIAYKPSIFHGKLRIVRETPLNRVIAQSFQSRNEQVKQLLLHVYEASSVNDLGARLAMGSLMPAQSRVEEAGVEIDDVFESLSLQSFETRVARKSMTVAKPTSHLGQSMAPSASDAVPRAIRFYETKLQELRQLCA